MFPFQSDCKHFIQRVNVYCAKVLPLVFDNSLSYYEQICRFAHKLNELVDSLNAQNLNIIEFTKMVSLEVEKFEKYIESRQTEFEEEQKKAFEEFRTELNNYTTEFLNRIQKQWEEQKTQLQNFMNGMQASWDSFKDDINNEIENFENSVTTDITEFKNTMQTQQNEFEAHMTSLYNSFTSSISTRQDTFETEFQKLFENWKIETLNALERNIQTWENSAEEKLTLQLTSYINGKLDSFETVVDNRLVLLSQNLTKEIEARETADAALQRQIDNITIGNSNAVIPIYYDDSGLSDNTLSETATRYDILNRYCNVWLDGVYQDSIHSINKFLVTGSSASSKVFLFKSPFPVPTEIKINQHSKSGGTLTAFCTDTFSETLPTPSKENSYTFTYDGEVAGVSFLNDYSGYFGLKFESPLVITSGNLTVISSYLSSGLIYDPLNNCYASPYIEEDTPTPTTGNIKVLTNNGSGDYSNGNTITLTNSMSTPIVNLGMNVIDFSVNDVPNLATWNEKVQFTYKIVSDNDNNNTVSSARPEIVFYYPRIEDTHFKVGATLRLNNQIDSGATATIQMLFTLLS